MKIALQTDLYSLKNIRNYFARNKIPSIDMYTCLNVSLIDEYKIIQLNRPSKMNSWDLVLTKELWDFTSKSKNNFIIFKGDDKSFSTGADLKFFLEHGKTKNELYNQFFYYTYDIFHSYHNHFRDNTVFIWNGATMGGGLSIGAYSKFRIATESTVVAMPEAKFNFFSNCIFSDFIGKYLSPIEALHFSLFSEFYSSYEVYLTTIASHFVLNKYISSLIEEITLIKDPFNNTELIKGVIDKYHSLSVKEYKAKERETYEEKVITRRKLLSELYSFTIDRSNFDAFYSDLSRNLKLISPELYKVFLSKSRFTIKVNFDITMAAFDQNLTYEDRFNLDTHYINVYNETNFMYDGISQMFKQKQSKAKF